MSDHSTLEERLTRSLDQQATGLHDAPFTFDDVRGRARGIQRRRRGIAAGVAAAVVAIALPAALLSGGDGPKTDGVDPAPPVVPTSPAASVLHDGVLTRPDGSTVEVDLADDVLSLGVLTDGRIVATSNSSRKILVLAADGSLEASYPVTTTTFTMGVDDRTVAWDDPNFGIQVLESGAAEPIEFPGVPMPGEAVAAINAVLGSGCAGGGCTLIGGGDADATYEITLADGAVELATPEPFRVESVSPDKTLWAVQYADDADPQYGCSGLYDVAANTIVARTCDTSNLEFAPDGQHLFGMRQEGGPITDSLSVLDLDLTEVRSFEPAGRLVSDVGWQDADHLLVGVADLEGTEWSLLRVPVAGGAAEELVGPVAGELPEMVQEFLVSD